MDSGTSLGPGWHKLFIRHAILHLSRAKFSNHLKQSVNWQVCEALVLLRCPWQRFALNCVQSIYCIFNIALDDKLCMIRLIVMHMCEGFISETHLHINTSCCQFPAPSQESWWPQHLFVLNQLMRTWPEHDMCKHCFVGSLGCFIYRWFRLHKLCPFTTDPSLFVKNRTCALVWFET